MASPSNSVGQGEAAAQGLSTATNSCNRCRRTKLRCSRERPACSHCSKAGHECVYECARGKPGVKTGAIENIHRRLDELESRLRRQESEFGSRSQTKTQDGGNHGLSHGLGERVLTLLATELPKLATGSPCQDRHDSPQQQGAQRRAKRRRIESTYNVDALRDFHERPPLPSSDMIDTIVVTYFSHIHPWIPMLHQTIFPEKLKSAEGLRKLQAVLHAVCLAVEPHLPPAEDSSSSSSLFDSHWPADKVRTWVVTTALEDVTLEGLQALIIMAFNDIGNGNASRAWSIVASLSRTVEFAQLTMEHDEDHRQLICRPFTTYIEPARSWTEQEERRRVFWCVFLLDRFCSTTMGWNTSLKSIDVHQRMPCDGSLWKREVSGLTPYLGVWDKSTGGMGYKTCCCPTVEQPASSLGSEPWTQPGAMYSASPSQSIDSSVDMSRVGAFGYCVEATESMSRVVSYFLQQRVNMDDPNEVNSWLARFKELDLRLVHWKMFLPQKWKTNVPPSSQLHGRLRIDPNLALAHITHNTSTILLHQVIAYPLSDWPFRKRLPSAWSADTCCFAAAEIATITGKWLEITPNVLPVTSSFAFCVYIAARMMIVHWRYEPENKLMDEFWSLVGCLEEMSKRWRGFGSTQIHAPGADLSAKYAAKLRGLYKMCSEDEDARIFPSDFTCEINYRAPPTGPDNASYSTSMAHGLSDQPATFAPQPDHSIQGQTQGPWAAGITGGILPLPDMTETAYAPQQQPQPHVSSSNFAVEVSARGQASWGNIQSHENSGAEDMQMANMIGHLNDSMDMERVITFDDRALFTAELENAVW